MLDLVVLRIRVQRPRMITADAHDLGARGLELRQGRVDAANLLRSGARECLDERVENDGPVGSEVREFHLLAPGSRKGEGGCLVPYLERAQGPDHREASGQSSEACYNDLPGVTHRRLLC